MKQCKLCKEPLLENEISNHLVRHHKEKLMEFVDPMTLVCVKCGTEFNAKPEPTVKNHDLFWFAPAWCKECSGHYFGFIVDYVEPKIRKEKVE